MEQDSKGLASAILGEDEATMSIGAEPDIDSEDAALESATMDFMDAMQSGDVQAGKRALRSAILAIYPRSQGE